MRKKQLSRASLALLVLAGGCNWNDFDKYEKSAPIRAYDSPSNRVPGYGRVLAAVDRPDVSDGALIAASAGRNAPVAFERMWNGAKLGTDTITRCKKATDCAQGAGVGATLIPVPVWARGTPQEESACILSPGVPKAYIFCDTDSNANQSWSIDLGADYPSPDSGVFFSGVGLPPGHALGVAILGTYEITMRSGSPTRGRLFYQPEFLPAGLRSDEDVVPKLEVLPLRDPRNGELFANDAEPGDLGYAMSLATAADGTQLIAISQPSHKRVIVASYDERLPGTIADKLRTRACLTPPDSSVPGYGKKLLLGDINNDGLPELFVGIDPSDRGANPESTARLWMYRGVTLPALAQAEDDCPLWPNPVQVGCYEGVRSVSCAGSAFGTSLAIGDVDGDGYGDLIAGAPYANVQGGKAAGAVWLIPGGPDSPDTGGLDFERMTNLFATKKSNANLGTAVAALRTKDRYEPVAGAPGEDRVYTFMCSKLEESSTSLCLP